MTEKYNLKGGCTCGKVKYSISEKPLFTQACHCVDCKISTGSSYVIHTTILDKTLSVDGKVASTILPTGSGKGYRALANISEHGGQEVPHLHFHLFGGERVGKMVEWIKKLKEIIIRQKVLL